MMDRRSSVSNALAAYEANIAKSAEAQSRSFLTNVAASNKKKTAAGANQQHTSPPASPTRKGNPIVVPGSPPASPKRRPRQRSARIQNQVQKFDNSATSLGHDDQHAEHSHAASSAIKQQKEVSRYEYDYNQTKKLWNERTKTKQGSSAKLSGSKKWQSKRRLFHHAAEIVAAVQAWTPHKLRQRRKQVKQESLAQRMPKRSSMGLVGTLSQEFKAEDLYPELFAVQEQRPTTGIATYDSCRDDTQSSSSKSDKNSRNNCPANRRGSLRNYHSTSDTHDKRSKHRRRRGGKRKKQRKSKEGESLPANKQGKAKRRNSTGRVRFNEEPIVNIYWNPAGPEDPDEDDLAQSTWRHDEHAQSTEDYSNSSLDDTKHSTKGNKDVPVMEKLQQKGLIQRRKSTGWARFTQEPTHWLYSREDHEIQKASIPSREEKEKQKKRRKEKHEKERKSAKSKSKKASKQSKRETSIKSTASRKDAEELETERPKEEEEASVPMEEDSKQLQEPTQHPVIVLPQAIPVHEEQSNSPLRVVKRRLSTGAVPLDNEADSRLHRKQQIKRESKRKQGATLRRERHFIVSPFSPGKPRKASLMGLLDPMSALADDSDDPKCYLVGNEDCYFTIAPLYSPKNGKETPTKEYGADSDYPVKFFLNNMMPLGMGYDQEEASDIENSGHSVLNEDTVKDDDEGDHAKFLHPSERDSRADSFALPRSVQAAPTSERPGRAGGDSFAYSGKRRPEELPTLESDDDVDEEVGADSEVEGPLELVPDEDTADEEEATFVESNTTTAQISLDDSESSVSLPDKQSGSKKQTAKGQSTREPKSDALAEDTLQDSNESASSTGWGFKLVQPGWQVKRFVDSTDNVIKEKVITEKLPEPRSARKQTTKPAPKRRPVQLENDEDSDSSITSFSSSASESSDSESTIHGSVASVEDTHPVPTTTETTQPKTPAKSTNGDADDVQEMPALDDFEDADYADDDCSSSSDNTFPNVLRPGVTRSRSFENDKALLKTLQEFQIGSNQEDETTEDHNVNGEVQRAKLKRQPSAELDRESLQSVNTASVDDKATDDAAAGADITDVYGHPTAHMIKSVAKLEREEKKEKRKKREKDKEKKLKKKKSKDSSNSESRPCSEERKKRSKSKSKEKERINDKVKEREDKSLKKDKDPKKDRKSKREKRDKELKKVQSERQVTRPNGSNSSKE